MSTSSQVPSAAIAERMRGDHLLRVGHVVDAVERRHQIDRTVGRQRLDPRVVEVDVGDACFGLLLLGAGQRVLGDVVAVERRRGERLGHHDQRPARAAADVGDRRTGLQLGDHAVERREHDGQEERAVPRLEAALDADGALRSVRSRSRGRARCGSSRGAATTACIVCGKRWNMPMPNAGWSGSASTTAASGLRENRSGPPSGVSASTSLAAAWLCTHSWIHRASSEVAVGELVDGHRCAGATHRRIQAEPVAEVDHPRRDGAVELGEDQQRVELELVRVDVGRHDGST